MRNLLLAKDVPSKRLIVLSEHEVASLPLHRCSSSAQALTCEECVALRDPYCAWSLGRELCVSHADETERGDLLQNVDVGLHERCPPRIQVIVRGENDEFMREKKVSHVNCCWFHHLVP